MQHNQLGVWWRLYEAEKADHFDNVGLYTSHDDSVYLIYHKFNEMIENAAQSLKMQFTFKLDTD